MDILYSILVTTIISIPLTSLISFLIKAWINSGFSKKIEKFKSELDNITRIQEFKFKKALDDYSLYSAKKHEIYRNLFAIFSESFGHLFSLSGFTIGPDYNVLSKADILEIIPSLGISDTDKKEIINSGEIKKKDDIISEIRRAEYKVKVVIADQKFSEFKNFSVLNEIYFADDINRLIDEIIKQKAKLITSAKIRAFNSNKHVQTGIDEELIKTSLSDLKDQLRRVIRNGLLNSD
ncbi:hypothetical protein [Leptospira sarikeiensis]|uniref:Uncharacterized protein n=1 Tax=Leptospira sarikeiensis TaxID=2484943 RepID=A0A4R9K324_9LEPT|nr:hypothetical protein [Leptospira sarikeiensis]TGL58708.1 hypothetical protein EHQ64_16790 [Leptospira sarikeiensis]